MKTFVRVLSLCLVAVLLCTAFVACGVSSNPDKAVDALKEAKYEVDKESDADDLKFYEEMYEISGLVAMVSALKVADGKSDSITLYYFEKTADAKAALEKMEKAREDIPAEYKEGITLDRSGKVIYSGTAAAIEVIK